MYLYGFIIPFCKHGQQLFTHRKSKLQLTGSYKFLICFIRLTMVALLLYPMYGFLAIPSPCSAEMLPFLFATHSYTHGSKHSSTLLSYLLVGTFRCKF